MALHWKRYAPLTDRRDALGRRMEPEPGAPTMSLPKARALSEVHLGGRRLVWRLDPTGWRCII